MQKPFRKLSNILLPVLSLCLLVGFFLYLWLFVDLKLIYHSGGWLDNFPIFYKGWHYFSKFIVYSGGLSEYAASFLAQLFKYSWAGALVVTIQCSLIILCVNFILKKLKLANMGSLGFIAAFVMVATYAQYTYYFTITFAFLISLIFICLYLHITPKKQGGKLVWFLVLSLISYYITGGGFLLFAVSCSIYELLYNRNLLLAGLYALLTVILPYSIGVMVLNQCLFDSYLNELAFHWKYICYIDSGRMVEAAYIMYAIVPSIIILPKAYEFITRKKITEHITLGISIKQTLIVIIIAVTTGYFSYDFERKSLFETNYYQCHENWSEVLKSAKKHWNSVFTITAATNALYHSGRLADQQFSIPQSPDILFLSRPELMPAHWGRVNIFLDLGLLNCAEHELACAIEKFGERPYLLQKMAFVNLVKGDINTAKVYLGSLNKTLFDNQWAKNYLRKIEQDSNLTSDGKIQFYRGIMMQENYGSNTFEEDYVLKSLLKTNKKNKMAFEYLMALYLLRKDIDGFVDNIHYLRNFNYLKVPTSYEQAFMVYIAVSKNAEINLPVSPAAKDSFIEFYRIFDRYQGNQKAAYPELAKKFGNSYMFYYLYSRSGMKQ